MIELEDVTIRAGRFELQKVSLCVPSGNYAVLMGRTGRGKTTLLEAICGLRAIASGSIRIDGTDVTDWSAGDRQIGYVPQDLALFPTFTVREHFEFALRLRKQPRPAIEKRTVELAGMLKVEALLNRSIEGLSGGERQRVALGRALSFRPSVLLLDEPLSALDESTRIQMQKLLREIKSEQHVTTLHVTHSQSEAEAVADLQLVIRDGHISIAGDAVEQSLVVAHQPNHELPL
ncbi:ABC transporter ATP-binding protein [Novipirellula artificiosorum]|uniref:Sulfate/thiosulfate import ATP-binding protein CysA n=1 Tax=Novipirellula artificiosorum TaxID=2528016 RepID=A0A5C6DSD7_9BACT|nr:ABC transporter ATP-binding protein [Novipirellula artificiosorum]TWU39688.1 Sulfate/thiosulfate import ATP-binding protein CysA [Novipirellula artificiosorum]